MIMDANFTPDNYGMIYKLEKVMRTFTEYRLSEFEKISFTELVRTEFNKGYNNIKNVDTLFRIRSTNNWRKCKYTGLRKAETERFYYADLPIKEKKSLFVAYISDDLHTIYIRICPQFYPLPHIPNARARIVRNIIQKMLDDLKLMESNEKIFPIAHNSISYNSNAGN